MHHLEQLLAALRVAWERPVGETGATVFVNGTHDPARRQNAHLSHADPEHHHGTELDDR